MKQIQWCAPITNHHYLVPSSRWHTRIIAGCVLASGNTEWTMNGFYQQFQLQRLTVIIWHKSLLLSLTGHLTCERRILRKYLTFKTWAPSSRTYRNLHGQKSTIFSPTQWSKSLLIIFRNKLIAWITELYTLSFELLFAWSIFASVSWHIETEDDTKMDSCLRCSSVITILSSQFITGGQNVYTVNIRV